MSISSIAFPVAVIGAGPVGLAAAAHLRARGMSAIVLEAGASVGANLESYRHVRLFSPWRFNLDRVSTTLLEDAGWRRPDLDVLPTAGEIIDQYLEPLSRHPAIATSIRLRHTVISISREGVDKVRTAKRELSPFVLHVRTPQGDKRIRSTAVIDSSGTWSQPNPLGANGIQVPGETQFARHIRYGMPDILGRDRLRYAGKRVLVVGSGHSAAGNLIALAELAATGASTQIVWAIRGDNLAKVFGGGEADGFPARGELGTRLRLLQASGRLELFTNFRIDELRAEDGRIAVYSAPVEGPRNRIGDIDEIIASTGARPNLEMTRELRLKIDHWLESTELLAPLIDPNEHSCGTVRPHGHRELAHPEPAYYAVGARSYGRAPTFLMTTGYEQVRSVVAALAGDLAAADDVQLELPETGVCSVSFGDTGANEASAACCGASPREKPIAATASPSGCCGGPAKVSSDACCVLDEVAKEQGQTGCGCGPKSQAIESRREECCA